MKEKIITGCLKCLAVLPLGVLYLISDFIFFFVYYVLKYRRKVTRCNLREAFPEKSEKEIGGIEKEYYHYLCDIIVETVKLLHISDGEMARRVEAEGSELIAEKVAEGKSVVLLLGHYGNWEWVQEIGRNFPDTAYKASIYHPLKSRVWDGVYKRIRSRWRVNIIPQKSAVKRLLSKDNQPWICGFIADHRPVMADEDARIDFLNHDMAFIYGPETIGKKLGAEFFYVEMERRKRGYYKITFHQLTPDPSDDKYPYTRDFWRRFEETLRRAPAYWLWSHKRWKYDRVYSSLPTLRR